MGAGPFPGLRGHISLNHFPVIAGASALTHLGPFYSLPVAQNSLVSWELWCFGLILVVGFRALGGVGDPVVFSGLKFYDSVI